MFHGLVWCKADCRVCGCWLRYMSISRLSVFLIINISRKHILFSVLCVELSCMSLCTRHMCLLMRSGLVLSVSYIIRMSSTYRV